ncbi:aa3-type cytochrome c oxidase subunit IV [Tropicimonas aquimaris]|uniref:Aa3-type cytochrome c oxidase subunit IV n=1 Tax=Tropicimonas aquimaris TaxID=914152 RepID=A0ABW3IV87_9RHOB
MSGESYKHGSMDISTQEKTFDGFIKMVVRTAILCIVVLIFIALVNG